MGEKESRVKDWSVRVNIGFNDCPRKLRKNHFGLLREAQDLKELLVRILFAQIMLSVKERHARVYAVTSSRERSKDLNGILTGRWLFDDRLIAYDDCITRYDEVWQTLFTLWNYADINQTGNVNDDDDSL